MRGVTSFYSSHTFTDPSRYCLIVLPRGTLDPATLKPETHITVFATTKAFSWEVVGGGETAWPGRHSLGLHSLSPKTRQHLLS